jgi:hypothetical protein
MKKNIHLLLLGMRGRYLREILRHRSNSSTVRVTLTLYSYFKILAEIEKEHKKSPIEIPSKPQKKDVSIAKRAHNLKRAN